MQHCISKAQVELMFQRFLYVLDHVNEVVMLEFPSCLHEQLSMKLFGKPYKYHDISPVDIELFLRKTIKDAMLTIVGESYSQCKRFHINDELVNELYLYIVSTFNQNCRSMFDTVFVPFVNNANDCLSEDTSDSSSCSDSENEDSDSSSCEEDSGASDSISIESDSESDSDSGEESDEDISSESGSDSSSEESASDSEESSSSEEESSSEESESEESESEEDDITYIHSYALKRMRSVPVLNEERILQESSSVADVISWFHPALVTIFADAIKYGILYEMPEPINNNYIVCSTTHAQQFVQLCITVMNFQESFMEQTSDKCDESSLFGKLYGTVENFTTQYSFATRWKEPYYMLRLFKKYHCVDYVDMLRMVATQTFVGQRIQNKISKINANHFINLFIHNYYCMTGSKYSFLRIEKVYNFDSQSHIEQDSWLQVYQKRKYDMYADNRIGVHNVGHKHNDEHHEVFVGENKFLHVVYRQFIKSIVTTKVGPSTNTKVGSKRSKTSSSSSLTSTPSKTSSSTPSSTSATPSTTSSTTLGVRITRSQQANATQSAEQERDQSRRLKRRRVAGVNV